VELRHAFNLVWESACVMECVRAKLEASLLRAQVSPFVPQEKHKRAAVHLLCVPLPLRHVVIFWVAACALVYRNEGSEERSVRVRSVGWTMHPGNEVSGAEVCEARSIRGTRCPGAKPRMGNGYGGEVSEGQCVQAPSAFWLTRLYCPA